MSIADMIKRHRERRRWSQRDLAERAGVTAAYIAMLETGTKKNPSPRILRSLERALGLKRYELDRAMLPREWWRPESDRDLSDPDQLTARGGAFFATREE